MLSCQAAPKKQSPLSKYVASLQASSVGAALGLERMFPMFVMPAWIFFKMTEVIKHEELVATGSISEFHESMGRALFVSHQWLGIAHPDPNFEQLRVLQEALLNLMAGTTKVSLPPVIELWFGRLKLPTAADFNDKALYIWYDYFCIPQTALSIHQRQDAISSIPWYISRCFFFVILIPAVEHEEGHVLSLESWELRGWCRLESMSRSLSREDGFMITIKVASNPTLANNLGGLGKAPGLGLCSVEADRARFGPVLLKLMWSKLQNLLFEGDLHNYRFLLNLQWQCLQGLEVRPWESLVPDFDTEIDPATDPHAFIVARFLHETGFSSVLERDKAGWSPMCYAVLRDDPYLVEALAISKADVNDSNRKAKNDAQLPKGLPVLSIAGTYRSNKAMKALLLARANVNAKDSLGGNALTASIGMGNKEAIGILCGANIDVNVKLLPGTGPFKVACGFGGIPTIQELMAHKPDIVKLRYCLHFGIIFYADVHTVSYLLEQGADINEQLEIPFKRNTGWWILLKVLSMGHQVSPSALTYLAYHHRGATPLILSIIVGKFDCSALLLSKGARRDLRNSHGRSAEDIARETHAPISLREELRRESGRVFEI